MSSGDPTAVPPSGIIARLGDVPGRDRILQTAFREQLASIHVGRDLATLRLKRGVTRYELAEVLKTHPTQITRVETETATNTGVHTLVKMAAALGGRLRITIDIDPPTDG